MDWEEKITQDNLNAAWLAEELASTPGIVVSPELVETNILRFKIEPEVLKKMKTDYHGFVGRLREEYGVLANSGFANDYVRFVTHRNISRADCEKVIKVVKSMTSV